MQTFLPFADFRQSMMVLDPSRLGNQVYREGMTLIRGGWPNHPASKMWRGCEQALAMYLLFGVEELLARGYDYRDRPWCHELVKMLPIQPIKSVESALSAHRFILNRCILPPWLGDEAIHASHRGVLLWKNPEWYSQFGWKDKPRPPRPDGKMDYVWPEV